MVKFKKLRKGDSVKVTSGKNIGKSGTIIEVDRDKGRVLIQGVNFVRKTFRKSKKNPTGGIKDVEAFLNISNVMLICPKCKKPARIGYLINEKDDTKKRFCKKCKSAIE